MMAVPRRSERAADQEAEPEPDTHVNGKVEASASPSVEDEAIEPEAETSLLPVLADQASLTVPRPVPNVNVDPGLYAVLGLDPQASDAQIQTAYRRLASKLMGGGRD